MNDYDFGNYLYQMRKAHGDSQRRLAEKLGISPKAVSKWETGAAKPKTEHLRQLAALWGISVETLLKKKEEKQMSVTKIVITGGPCAGKTTGLSWIANAFTDLGYTVLFVPETATELISGGVAPQTCGSNEDYQKCQMELQLSKERVFEAAARSMKSGKILIVCDRGALDNRAYMNDAEFARVLAAVGQSEVELRDSYDAVFHLLTAAKGAEKFYTADNNSARTETPAEAVALDDKLIAAWTGHPHLRIIDNSVGFEDKMKKLITEISAFLGEPEPYEIERKFLIEYPDLAALTALPNCEKLEIIQTYLKVTPGEELRIRQRGSQGHYLYFETRKKILNDMTRIETERRLTQAEYLTRLMDADPALRPIRKDRYCISLDNHYYELDIYPFWEDQAILEIELSSPDEEVELPAMFRLIREVTDDPAYKNAALARR